MAESVTGDGVTLTAFARGHVNATFTAAGARKKGRRYEFTNSLGDVSWFDLFSRGWDGGVVGFDAGMAFNPRTNVEWWEWSRHEQGITGFTATHLQAPLWAAGVLPPPQVEHLGHWGFHDADGAARCGAALAPVLADTVVPLLLTALDRRALLRAFEDGAVPDPHRMSGTPERTRVLLLLDDDEDAGADADAELDAALDAVCTDRDFHRWATGRAARGR